MKSNVIHRLAPTAICLALIPVAIVCSSETKENSPAPHAEKILTSFEKISLLAGLRRIVTKADYSIVAQHSTHGSKALKLEKGHFIYERNADWSDHDYLAVDLFTESTEPLELHIQIYDERTRGYWSRVNYTAIAPPGGSTQYIPLNQLFVGEKSRPGRALILDKVTKLVFRVGENLPAPLYIDKVRLKHDTETEKFIFDDLFAFDLGKRNSPVMPGFTSIDASSLYTPEIGFGLKDAQIWRSFDVLQPEPLYQDFICIENGGLAVDVPNGKYHVFVNMDNPSGYWGEFQRYSNRSIIVEDQVVAEDTMTMETLKKKYFRFWDVEDGPDENTFDKYQVDTYEEKEFDVVVTDNQLNIDFSGSNWACSVSAIVIFPSSKIKQGKAFLDFIVKKRRFFFDAYFKRVLHKPSSVPATPTSQDQKQGYIAFVRDYMQDVYYNDRPFPEERTNTLNGSGFSREMEPLTLSIYPLRDLGNVRISVTDLEGPGGVIPSGSISLGYVSNRIARKTNDGTVYTIRPRWILPRSSVVINKGITRRFWLTLHVPPQTAPGVYTGTLSLVAEDSKATFHPVEFRVYKGTLEALDLPVGPWGHRITIPWLEQDPKTQAWNDTMTQKSLRKLREYGFTTFTGMPILSYSGFHNGKPKIRFDKADKQMKMARDAGFTMPIVSYLPLHGLNLYYKDNPAMSAAGFRNYDQFIHAIFSLVQKHARAHNWLPIYWNIGDEPLGDDLLRAVENAEEYRRAFPVGPPFFTAATSFVSGDKKDLHFRFGNALHVANLSEHNIRSVNLLIQAGSDWAFYNGGNRWTLGIYMYKIAKQFNMKFRLDWHWNAVKGNPYYALDCRQDDYAWVNANPEGTLVSSIEFEREMREGIDDYRYMLTLANLAKIKGDQAAKDLIKKKLASFDLGQRKPGDLFPVKEWRVFRRKMANAIERFQK